MKGVLYIDDTAIGEADLKVIDRSMGAIGGDLFTYAAYEEFQSKIQSLVEKKGIANAKDFTFKIILIDNILIYPDGGIGITDLSGIEGVFVEAAGIGSEIISLIEVSD